jgi:hypothetical protein
MPTARQTLEVHVNSGGVANAAAGTASSTSMPHGRCVRASKEIPLATHPAQRGATAQFSGEAGAPWQEETETVAWATGA